MENKVLIPNLYGIFEIKSATKNRIRMEIDKLKNNKEDITVLKENLKKITAVKSFKIIQSLGSISIEFDETQIDAQLMVGIILKLLNLDDELLKSRKAKIRSIFSNFGKITDISIHNKTKGFFDTKTLLGTGLLIYGIKKFKSEMFLPSGATLIWWAYRLLSKNNN